MAKIFLTAIDLNQNELQNAVLQNLATNPTSTNTKGRMLFNTTDNLPYWFNGSKWMTFADAASVTTLEGYFTDGVANDSSKLGGVSLGDLFADLTSDAANAIGVKIGGVWKYITTDTLQSSLGLGSFAYKDSLVESEIPNLDWSKIATGKPSTLGGYGITDAYTATQIDNLLKEYLPLSGGTITGDLTVNGTLRIDGATLTWDSTKNALIVDKAFASEGAISTLGLGSDSEGIGTSIDLTSVTTDILPSDGLTLSIGSESNPWEEVYINGIGSVRTVISNLQTSNSTLQSKVNAVTSLVGDIQNTYATIAYVDGQIEGVREDIALLLENTSTEAIDSIKEIVNIIGDAGSALVKRYNETITGTGSKTSFTVTHNLATKNVLVFVYEASTNQQVFVDVAVTGANVVTLSFAKAPTTSDKYNVVILA